MTEPAAEPSLSEIVQEEDFPHPPAVVWRGLTEPDLLGRWLMTADFAPQVGRPIRFRMEVPPNSPWDGIVKGEVLEAEPERRLVISWISGGVDTRVTYTLTPIDTGTRLKMVHSGFDPAGHPQAFQGAAYGWKRNLGRLRDLLGEIAA